MRHIAHSTFLALPCQAMYALGEQPTHQKNSPVHGHIAKPHLFISTWHVLELVNERPTPQF